MRFSTAFCVKYGEFSVYLRPTFCAPVCCMCLQMFQSDSVLAFYAIGVDCGRNVKHRGGRFPI